MGFLQPLLACAVMGAAVFGIDRALAAAGVSQPLFYLFAEIAVGAVAYVIAALLICRATAKDLIGLLGKALRKHLGQLMAMKPDKLIEDRYRKFRALGPFTGR